MVFGFSVIVSVPLAKVFDMSCRHNNYALSERYLGGKGTSFRSSEQSLETDLPTQEANAC